MRRSVGPWLVATAGVITVAAVHLAFGFNWLSGLAALRIRYYQGIASDRPFSYFVYANVAAWLISCSPLLAVGLSRAVGVLARGRRRPWTEDTIVAHLAMSGLAAALVTDASALSKGETERIWLAFGVLASSGLALLRGQAAKRMLLGCATWALLVNHLFNTGW